MTDNAFKATFCDVKLLKGRKQAQLVFEVPIEEVDAALAVLGGMPQPMKEAWVGIARLDPESTPEKAPIKPEKPVPAKGEKAPFDSLPYPQQAGILCADTTFQHFIGAISQDEAVQGLYKALGIKSRSEIAPMSAAEREWTKLVGVYRSWLRYGNPNEKLNLLDAQL